VDKNVSVEFNNINLKGEYSQSPDTHVFVRVGHFREDRISRQS